MVKFVQENLRWLAAGGIATFGSCFGQTFFISIFSAQIMAFYGLTDGEWGAIYGAGTMVSGFLMIWAGSLADVYPARNLMVVLLAGLSVFCLAMALNNITWLLPFLIFGLRFFGQGMLYHVGMIAIARWFTANRGKAIAVANLGFSIGEAFLPLIFVALLGLFAWQQLWTIAAVLSLLYLFLAWKLFSKDREASQFEATAQSQKGMFQRDWTRLEVIKHPVFWLLIPMIMAPSAFGTALFFQQVHLAEVKGWGHTQFVALFPLYTTTTVMSALVFGWALDKLGSGRILPFYQIPMAIAFFAIGGSDSFIVAIFAMFLMGVMQGGNATLLIAFWAEAYGTKHIGSIKALTTAMMVLGSAIGPYLSGEFIDLGYSFPDQMPFYAIAVLCFCVLTFIGSRIALSALSRTS